MKEICCCRWSPNSDFHYRNVTSLGIRNDLRIQWRVDDECICWVTISYSNLNCWRETTTEHCQSDLNRYALVERWICQVRSGEVHLSWVEGRSNCQLAIGYWAHHSSSKLLVQEVTSLTALSDRLDKWQIPFCKMKRSVVSIHECFAMGWLQWTSNAILIATGEWLSRTGTQNELWDKYFIATTGTEISYRCPTSRNCKSCKHHDEYEKQSASSIINSSINIDHQQLWKGNSVSTPCRVETSIYGVRSSGNQAKYGLRKIVELFQSNYPEVTEWHIRRWLCLKRKHNRTSLPANWWTWASC